MDTSDRLVQRMHLKVLRQFAQIVDRNYLAYPAIRAELARIVAKDGIGSIAYDNYLKSISAFIKVDEP